MLGSYDWISILLLTASLLTGNTPVEQTNPSEIQQETQAVPSVTQAVTPTPEQPELIYDPVPTPEQPTENSASVGAYDEKEWWFRRTK